VIIVAGSGNGVEVVPALAGTGKTRMLGALAGCYRQTGYRIVGAAPTGRAARELGKVIGAPTSTLHRLIEELDRSGGFTDGTVILFDEAAMAPTRQTAALLAHADRSGAKVVAAGDAGQLPSVQAGGWFAAVTRKLGGVKLREVMRQRNPDERAALEALHGGDPDVYLAFKQQQRELCVHADERDDLAMLSREWDQARTEYGLSGSVMIARDNATRALLNEEARAALKQDGTVACDGVTVAGREFCVGERVIARRNDRHPDIDNGTCATITAIDPLTGAGRACRGLLRALAVSRSVARRGARADHRSAAQEGRARVARWASRGRGGSPAEKEAVGAAGGRPRGRPGRGVRQPRHALGAALYASDTPDTERLGRISPPFFELSLINFILVFCSPCSGGDPTSSVPKPKRHPYDQWSPDSRALDLVGDKWTLLIVRDLAAGPRRFVELQRVLPGISTEQLRSRLNRMVAEGMLTRTRYREVPPRVDYELTERARELMPVLGELARWAYEWAWSSPRDSETVDVGAIFRLAPGLLAPAGITGTVEFTVEDHRRGGGAASYTFTLSDETVTIEELAAQRPDVRVSGAQAAWIAALSPEHDRTGLKITGDCRLAERLLDAFAGSDSGAVIVRAA
jgi:DNA-binding HxlR family transcriptional regulator